MIVGGQSKTCCFVSSDVESAVVMTTSQMWHMMQHPWARVWGLLPSQLAKPEADLAEFYFGAFHLYLISPVHGKGQ